MIITPNVLLSFLKERECIESAITIKDDDNDSNDNNINDNNNNNNENSDTTTATIPAIPYDIDKLNQILTSLFGENVIDECGYKIRLIE